MRGSATRFLYLRVLVSVSCPTGRETRRRLAKDTVGPTVTNIKLIAFVACAGVIAACSPGGSGGSGGAGTSGGTAGTTGTAGTGTSTAGTTGTAGTSTAG